MLLLNNKQRTAALEVRGAMEEYHLSYEQQQHSFNRNTILGSAHSFFLLFVYRFYSLQVSDAGGSVYARESTQHQFELDWRLETKNQREAEHTENEAHVNKTQTLKHWQINAIEFIFDSLLFI